MYADGIFKVGKSLDVSKKLPVFRVFTSESMNVSLFQQELDPGIC